MAAKYGPHQVLAESTAATPCKGSSSSLPTVGFLFLTGVNSFFSAYRARRDPWTLAFVLSAYSNLALLILSLQAYQRTPYVHVLRRQRLKLVILVLASTLNLFFSYQVANMLPPVLAAAVYSIAGLVTAPGICLLFVYASDDGEKHAETVDSRISCKEADALLGVSATV